MHVSHLQNLLIIVSKLVVNLQPASPLSLILSPHHLACLYLFIIFALSKCSNRLVVT
jgi:hypothetical protein